jgi:hypothetical protein
MRLFLRGTTPKQQQFISLWLQWQVVSWKGLGVLCIPMLSAGVTGHFIWAGQGILTLGLVLIVGISLHGASVGDQQRQMLTMWVSNANRWRRSTTWGTLWASLVISLVSFLGFSLSAALVVTLILMPFGLLVGLLTPLLSGGLGGLILGLNQQKVLHPHLQHAHLWPLWSGLGGLFAGLSGTVGGAILNELITDLIAVVRSSESWTIASPAQLSAISLLIGWTIYQIVTGFAMAWLITQHSPPLSHGYGYGYGFKHR